MIDESFIFKQYLFRLGRNDNELHETLNIESCNIIKYILSAGFLGRTEIEQKSTFLSLKVNKNDFFTINQTGFHCIQRYQ